MTKDQLKSLLELQEIEQQLHFLKRRLERLKGEKSKLKEKLASVENEIKSLRRKKEEIKGNVRKLKDEITLEEEALKSTEERLLRVRKDVEYKALLREKSKHEDNILKKSYLLDELESELKKVNDELLIKEEKAKREIEKLKEDILDIEEEIKLTQRKAEQTELEVRERRERMNASVLRLYDEAKEHYKGFVVVPVEDGVCTGCGIKIPEVLFSKLIKENSVDICPSCGRYIYYRL